MSRSIQPTKDITAHRQLDPEGSSHPSTARAHNVTVITARYRDVLYICHQYKMCELVSNLSHEIYSPFAAENSKQLHVSHMNKYIAN